MLWRDIRQSFTKSIGRFVSIACLVALGSFALVGLSVTGPDMRETGNEYFAQHHVADISIISGYGLNANDRTGINRAPGASHVEYGYLKDVVISDTAESIRMFSAPQTLSTYRVVQGHMPQTTSEIAMDAAHMSRYPLGSSITFTEKADQMGKKVLPRATYTVVGIVTSTEILSDVNMGASTSGSGALDGYGVVVPRAFESDVYMIARLAYTDLESIHDHYSSAYANRLQAHKDALDRILSVRPAARLKEVKAQLEPGIDTAQRQIDDAKKRLSDAQRQLGDVKAQLSGGAQQIAAARRQLGADTAAAQTKLAAGKTALAQSQADYDIRNKQYQANAAQVASARTQVDASQAQVNQSQAQIATTKDALEGVRQQLAKHVADAKASGNAATLAAAQAAYDAYVKGPYAHGLAMLRTQQTRLDGNIRQLNAAQQQVAAKERQLAAAKAQLDAARSQINQANVAIAQGEASLAAQSASAQSSIDAAQQNLDAKQHEYDQKLAEFNAKKPAAEKQINDSKAKLDDSIAKLNALKKPVYALDSRREIPGSEGYKVYDSVSRIVDSLAKIFPYFMYVVAALVTFTTMTRFVDEERINAGTLKALGYGNRDVMTKFVVYGFCASLIGAVIGIAAGHTLLPLIVYNSYYRSFNIPLIRMGFFWPVTLLALALAFLSAVAPAFLAVVRELRERPASLLLPKPPSAGSKIWLEHIGLIWNRMSFTHKVTARNIFRYKQRMLMTIFGVCGSVALLMAGFAVQGSVSGIANSQFGQIINYDLIVARETHVTASQNQQIGDRLKEASITRATNIHYDDMSKVAGSNNDRQSITLIVPQHTSELGKYIRLDTSQGHQPLTLNGQGAIISERFANLIGAKAGDAITVQDSGGNNRRVRVDGVCEMYIGHFMFMSPSTYSQVFGADYSTNASMVTLRDNSIANTKQQAASFMAFGGVKGVVQNTAFKKQIDTVVTSLNKIMQVLIIVACLLGVVILYNLTNLNVAERIRELSTIKVLGFYNNEVTMYIYRETILLSAFGVVVGYGFGAWLHRYIITAVPPDNVMFDPSIGWIPFVVPLVMIAVVTALLGWYVNRKLRNVDMLEALKSGE